MERINPTESKNNKPEFTVREVAPSVQTYLFENVGVVFDASGKNQTDFTELSFGTFDDIEQAAGEEVFQHTPRKRTVPLAKIGEYIKTAATAYGENTFWIYPYGKDGYGEARLRLFKKYANLVPDKNNFGYILHID